MAHSRSRLLVIEACSTWSAGPETDSHVCLGIYRSYTRQNSKSRQGGLVARFTRETPDGELLLQLTAIQFREARHLIAQAVLAIAELSTPDADDELATSLMRGASWKQVCLEFEGGGMTLAVTLRSRPGEDASDDESERSIYLSCNRQSVALPNLDCFNDGSFHAS